MGKMYKINKSQLVNRKVFFSRVSIGEKNGRQSYELTAVSFFRRWRLLDLRSRTRWLACGPQAYPRITCHAKKCSRSDALKSKETTIKGWSS